ncbi:MAG: T9SS type A sorting domain-containing protein [Bacteroidota bacterium]
MRSLILLAISMVALPVLAQTPGSCSLGTAQEFLDDSNVQASLLNNGNLFFGGSTTSGDGYLVPKASGNSPMFAAGIWVGGTVNGEIRVSAARYNGFLFRPGPLNADGTLPSPSDCSPYDRIYVVGASEIEAYESGQSPARDLADWPVGLGAPTVDANGAPLVSEEEPFPQDRTIDLEAGERPDLHGSQMAFWVMNDVGAPRGDNQTAPLGIEVRVTAFVIATDVDLLGASEASFYRFTIINRSTNTLEDARASFFTDPDLGVAGDDYMGTDTTRGMAFVYNSDEEDAVYGIPPAVGVDLLSGLSATSAYIGGGECADIDPGSPNQYYNNMKGLFGNGVPVTAYGCGYETVGDTTAFFFTGDPVMEAFWSEISSDVRDAPNVTGDRRAVVSANLNTLSPGDTAIVDAAVLFAQGTSYLDSITELRAVSDGVQQAYAAGVLFDFPQLVSDEGGPQRGDLTLGPVSPNPTASSLTVPYTLARPSTVKLAMVDVLGRQVLELVNARQLEGSHTATLDASALAPGVYLIQLRAGDETRTTRVTVVR